MRIALLALLSLSLGCAGMLHGRYEIAENQRICHVYGAISVGYGSGVGCGKKLASEPQGTPPTTSVTEMRDALVVRSGPLTEQGRELGVSALRTAVTLGLFSSGAPTALLRGLFGGQPAPEVPAEGIPEEIVESVGEAVEE